MAGFGFLPWLALLTLLHACKDDWDCSLAGTCVAGSCQCQPWTRGPDCAELNLTPMTTPSDLASIVQPAGNWSRWGGSVVQHDGLFHLFSAEMAGGCPLSVWGSKSTVIHSVSSQPMGPFRRLGVALNAEAHNPVVSRALDGTWLLWTCGCPNAPEAGCAHRNITCPGGKAAAWTTTVYSSASLYGPWKAHVDLLREALKGTAGLSQNVAPLMEPDGGVKLVFKGPERNTEASIVVAPHWRGPYRLLQRDIFARYYTENITNEDVWWWRGRDGSYHALSHRMEVGNRGAAACGGHAFAKSLVDWRYARLPAYTTAVAVAGGGQVSLLRRERPQLLLLNGSPQVLYTAVMPRGGGLPFTWAQQLAGEVVPPVAALQV